MTEKKNNQEHKTNMINDHNFNFQLAFWYHQSFVQIEDLNSPQFQELQHFGSMQKRTGKSHLSQTENLDEVNSACNSQMPVRETQLKEHEVQTLIKQQLQGSIDQNLRPQNKMQINKSMGKHNNPKKVQKPSLSQHNQSKIFPSVNRRRQKAALSNEFKQKVQQQSQIVLQEKVTKQHMEKKQNQPEQVFQVISYYESGDMLFAKSDRGYKEPAIVVKPLNDYTSYRIKFIGNNASKVVAFGQLQDYNPESIRAYQKQAEVLPQGPAARIRKILGKAFRMARDIKNKEQQERPKNLQIKHDQIDQELVVEKIKQILGKNDLLINSENKKEKQKIHKKIGARARREVKALYAEISNRSLKIFQEKRRKSDPNIQMAVQANNQEQNQQESDSLHLEKLRKNLQNKQQEQNDLLQKLKNDFPSQESPQFSPNNQVASKMKQDDYQCLNEQQLCNIIPSKEKMTSNVICNVKNIEDQSELESGAQNLPKIETKISANLTLENPLIRAFYPSQVNQLNQVSLNHQQASSQKSAASDPIPARKETNIILKTPNLHPSSEMEDDPYVVSPDDSIPNQQGKQISQEYNVSVTDRLHLRNLERNRPIYQSFITTSETERAMGKYLRQYNKASKILISILSKLKQEPPTVLVKIAEYILDSLNKLITQQSQDYSDSNIIERYGNYTDILAAIFKNSLIDIHQLSESNIIIKSVLFLWHYQQFQPTVKSKGYLRHDYEMILSMVEHWNQHFESDSRHANADQVGLWRNLEKLSFYNTKCKIKK